MQSVIVTDPADRLSVSIEVYTPPPHAYCPQIPPAFNPIDPEFVQFEIVTSPPRCATYGPHIPPFEAEITPEFVQVSIITVPL